MKKFIFINSAVLLFFCVSCSNKGGLSAKAKKNVETSQAISKCFETGDWSKIGDYIAADAVDHANPAGDVKGLDSIKAQLAKYSKMMADMKNETVVDLANDDYVMSWMKESFKMTVDEMGMKAGQNYTMNMIEVSKFKDGKVSEHWSFGDMVEMMKMMPPPPPPPAADTTKKSNKM